MTITEKAFFKTKKITHHMKQTLCYYHSPYPVFVGSLLNWLQPPLPNSQLVLHMLMIPSLHYVAWTPLSSSRVVSETCPMRVSDTGVVFIFSNLLCAMCPLVMSISILLCPCNSLCMLVLLILFEPLIKC